MELKNKEEAALLKLGSVIKGEWFQTYKIVKPTFDYSDVVLFLEGYPVKHQLSEGCKECPFKKDSAPGWLGPWNPLTLHQYIIGEAPFACHSTTANNDDFSPIELCAGSLIYAKNCGKSYRNRTLNLESKNIKKNKEDYLGFPGFLHHHNKNVKA